ncbi:MAG: dihydroneopterin aldolase [Ehrlichia sp.]
MKIQINGLVIYCRVGIRCWERVLKQKVIIDCELTVKQSCDSIRDIGNTIDYSAFKNRLVDFVNTANFTLLETMASDLLSYIIRDEKICHCYLKLYKPLALEKNANVSIIVESNKIENSD